MNRCFAVPATLLLLIQLGFGLPAQADDAVSFALDIRPILSDNCFACHGPDENALEAGLRLDRREDAVEFGALVPGQADQSELLRRILSDDESERMPPPETNKQLTEQQVDLIRRWIGQGAAYETHWAYRPLVRPEVPMPSHQRVANPIDAFLLSRLIDRGLDYSPPADRITIARRLYLDLLGVPPTAEEVDAFLADRGPTATQDLIERLLKDVRFGERMAVHWLDLVRYADTIGYHSDNAMEVSAYRDYVIDAFNQNRPFDEFTIEQLAGDLLPDPSDSQRIASGYNRLLQTTEEGGAQAKEYVAIYAADRVRNVSGVWMGSTMGCAQCHDHKYDPFTMRDFYSMAAFFADIREKAVGKRTANFKVYSDAERERLAELSARIDALQPASLLAADPELAESMARSREAWIRRSIERADSENSIWTAPDSVEVSASGGVELKPRPDGSFHSSGGNPDRGTYTLRITTADPVNAIRLDVFSDPAFPNGGFSRGNGNIVLTGVEVVVNDQPVKLTRAAADYEQSGWPVTAALDGKPSTGWAIDGHQRSAARRTAVFYLDQPIAANQSVVIRLVHQSNHTKHLIGRFRIFVSDQADAAPGERDPLPDSLLAAMRVPASDRTEAQRAQLAEAHRQIAIELEPYRQQLAEAERERQAIEEGVRATLVTEAMTEPRVTRILPRGNWQDDSGPVVEPAVPQFLSTVGVESQRANRLDLARWLVDDSNPLTARTFVNRLWKLFFGRGLSGNLDDLGGQGAPPTHPQLLDWLAVEFRDSGWDVKHMVRLMVNSSAYAQSSVATDALRSIDPDNRWYARQSRWRLEAEFVRDAVLQVSGLLSERVGGPSVKPYQPAGYWRHLNFPQRTWQPGSGEDLYRRSLYTFWCRTFLHPAMLAFDATSREECTAARDRSNTPQQALVLLNDPEFMEASRVLAAKLAAVDEPIESQIRGAFREAVSRQPSDEETELLTALFEDQSQRFRDAPDDARALLSIGESEPPSGGDLARLAALTQVTRAILNLYEATSRF